MTTAAVRRLREPTHVREHGTEVTQPATPLARIVAVRRIVSECQYAKIDGVMVDLFSASAIVKVYDALNDTNKAMFADFPVGKMASIAFKLLK